jgi:hypothetical protein
LVIEFSSTALAALLIVENPELVFTTRLGIRCSKGNIDANVPGTLPERLYKRAQLEVDSDDTNSCYRLTAQDAPITTDEIDAIQAEEEDGQALDKAIDTIKKTVQSSRNPVVTNRAMESQEQGTLGIASLFDV